MFQMYIKRFIHEKYGWARVIFDCGCYLRWTGEVITNRRWCKVHKLHWGDLSGGVGVFGLNPNSMDMTIEKHESIGSVVKYINGKTSWYELYLSNDIWIALPGDIIKRLKHPDEVIKE